MTSVVHIQTVIQTTFGVLDEDGNVIPQQPVQVQVTLFKPEAFSDAYAAIEQARDQAAANMEAGTDAPPVVSGDAEDLAG